MRWIEIEKNCSTDYSYLMISDFFATSVFDNVILFFKDDTLRAERNLFGAENLGKLLLIIKVFQL